MNVIQILVVFTVESFAVGVEPQNLYVFGEKLLRLVVLNQFCGWRYLNVIFQSFLDFCYK